MEYVRFLVDSSLGELEVQLFDDGWTAIDLSFPSGEAPSVEDIARDNNDLAEGFQSMGLPEDEAKELAVELWDELSDEERSERFRLRGLGERRKAWQSRTRPS
jgi:hypothetical protein